MNVVTITTCDEEWLGFHSMRFIKLAKRAMPSSTFIAVVVADPVDQWRLIRTDDPTLKLFDRVHYVKPPRQQVGYMYYNELRYWLLEMLGLDECLYVDPDVDIFMGLEMIPKDSDKPLMWCRSPVCPKGFDGLINMLGLEGVVVDEEGREIWNNSGLLYIRKDYLGLYRDACALCERVRFTPRMIGNGAFNVMLRMMEPEEHHELPYPIGMIWWERYEPINWLKDGVSGGRIPMWLTAPAVHYCNDQGKAERKKMHSQWMYLD